MIFLTLGVTVSHTFATSPHPCAPVTPPPVSGPLTQPPSAQEVLFINEVLLTPHTVWTCPAANTPPPGLWIELYNPQNEAFDLYSAHSRFDNGPGTAAFYLPFGAAIAAHSFLVIFPDTPMPLRSMDAATTLRLMISDTAIDQVVIPPLAADTSYARFPDGSNDWQITNAPTIDASNALPQPTPKATKSGSSSPGSGGNAGTSHVTGGATTGNQHSSSNSVGTADTQTTSINDNAQPTWSTLQFPDQSSSPALDTVSQTAATTQPLPDTSSSDLPRKILFTLVILALVLSLFWCYRLFLASQPSLHPDREAVETHEQLNE